MYTPYEFLQLLKVVLNTITLTTYFFSGNCIGDVVKTAKDKTKHFVKGNVHIPQKYIFLHVDSFHLLWFQREEFEDIKGVISI
jgi:hypothetical protein